MKFPVLVWIGLAALGFSACTTVPETGRRQMMVVSPGQEIQMGLAAFDQIKKEEKISTDPAANARVQRIGQRIARAVGRELPDAQWEFIVFESDQLNAFALPGGKVGVYTGLLKLAQSDDEIACVMGHEIAHVTSRHGGERMSQQIAASVVGAGAAIAMEAKDVDPNTRNLALGAFGALATGGVILPFSRLHETEADTVGLRFAASAGYDPRASITFWQRMSAANANKARPPKWLSTHPPDDERIANLQKLAPQYMGLYEAARTQHE